MQDLLSGHARAKPIVAHVTSTCLIHCEIQKVARKLFQHAAGKNIGERSYDAEKTSNRAYRIVKSVELPLRSMQEQLVPIPQGKLISEKISKRTANAGSYSEKILMYF